MAIVRRAKRSSLLDCLVQEKSFTIESSAKLVKELKQRQRKRAAGGYAGPSKTPVVVPRFSQSIQGRISVFSLLHRIGLATTPLVPNLADLSSTWAICRYIWAFKNRGSRLQLSGIAKNIDFHQKGVMSDEFGVGMSYWIMSKYFGASQPIDVDVALRNPDFAASLGAPSLTKVGNASPDYIYPMPNGNYSIVECKGGQSGRGASLNQLRRGLEQIPSVQIATRGAVAQYVVATLLSSSGVRVLIVDPPEDNDKKTGRARKYVVEDEKSFEREVANLRAAALMAYAGALGPARRTSKLKVPKLEARVDREEAPFTVVLKDLEVEAKGRKAVFQPTFGIDEELTLFMGLESSVYTKLVSRQDMSDIESIMSPKEIEGLFPMEEGPVAIISKDKKSAISIDRFGSVFMLSVGS